MRNSRIPSRSLPDPAGSDRGFPPGGAASGFAGDAAGGDGGFADGTAGDFAGDFAAGAADGTVPALPLPDFGESPGDAPPRSSSG
ncbi:MAG: hypothetical protein LBO76_00880 [Treponema sp.]|nr:hypothetical protein [Treponema sp.]